ncbi:FBLN5 [Mytilus coruscus]|uniref:FBLN5 n=1 Tax=Mytilus coruscus TaxID=42192 RepID=A0A6J8CD53_MYTCO|nr:FBLN5 [Mytilus coruscus]
MNEYESVVVKEIVKVEGETLGLSPYDIIQIKVLWRQGFAIHPPSAVIKVIAHIVTKFNADVCNIQDTDINECQLGIHNCQQLCTNTNGPFTCSCRTGYTLNIDQTTCTDIDECLESNNCTQLCNITIGSYVCNCHPGYQLERDGFTCTSINEWLDMTCLINGSCVNVAGSYSCQCNHGFSGDVCQSAHVRDKSYKSIAVGLGTGISLAFLLVAVLFIVLKTRRKKPSLQNGTYNINKDITVRSVTDELFDDDHSSDRYQSTQIETSMYEYESVTVKEVVKVDGKRVGQISQYDSIKSKVYIHI